MTALQDLVREAHRRSLWQVLSVYLVGSWVALQVVESLTESAGLPDWVPSFALVLLIIGLPIVLATAIVQEGVGSVEADDGLEGPGGFAGSAEVPEGSAAGTKRARSPAGSAAGATTEEDAAPGLRHRLFTWRNAVVGGVLAFALLGVVVAVYFLMWSSGIGPVGNLVAQGVIDDGDRVILSTFQDATDEGLGDVVTEALRVDLNEASVLRLVEDVEIAPALARMQVEPGTPLTAELAREVAMREGIKAVIEGDVASVGSGYLVTAAIRAAETGRSIASFRVTAEGPDELIGSIDKLSQDIREKSGESLRNIRAGEPLEQVTTRSTEALRLFTQAEEALDQGDERRSIELLEQAVALDPEFAMGWRKMAAVLNNTGTDPIGLREAATRAFEHRTRLTERERHLAAAFYYTSVRDDRAQTIAAYQNVLRVSPDDEVALNNLANVYQGIQNLERARELYRRAVDGPGRSPVAFQNLVRNRIGAGDFQGAWRVYEEYAEAYPEDASLPEARFWAAFVNADLETARAAAESQIGDPALPPFVRVGALHRMAQLAFREGRLDDARDRLLAMERLAAGVGPAFALVHRQWTILNEISAGDEAWARARALETIDDGTWEAVDPGAAPHFFVGLNLAYLGERERVERVLRAWRAAEPEAQRGLQTRVDMRRVELMLEGSTGTRDGVLRDFRALAEEFGCPTCWSPEEAAMAEWTGEPAEAIRLHEEIRRGGNTFQELNGAYRLRSTLVLGSLYEAVGDTARAVEAHRRVVDLWEPTADERGMERVRRARERIAALEG